MKVWRALASECWGWAIESVVFGAMFVVIHIGTWLRNHHLLPDRWLRYWVTRTVMAAANVVARSRRRQL